MFKTTREAYMLTQALWQENKSMDSNIYSTTGISLAQRKMHEHGADMYNITIRHG